MSPDSRQRAVSSLKKYSSGRSTLSPRVSAMSSIPSLIETSDRPDSYGLDPAEDC